MLWFMLPMSWFMPDMLPMSWVMTLCTDWGR